jgi:NAD(P)-dependent dehydrogenase (short-subunit alcohol dehydrogenase family)
MHSILVTGASTGIGRACALQLAGSGHQVFAGVRTDQDAAGLEDEGPALLHPVILDVTRQDQIDAVAERIAKEPGGLHGVVNNAGAAYGGPIEYIPTDAWRDQFEVNVFGQVAVTRAMLPMIREATGRIVFIGSIGGKLATMMMGPYNASKFAIEAIGESLRAELHPWGIHVSVIEPGAVKTEIWDKGRQSAERLERELPAEAVTRYAAHIGAIRKGIEMQDKGGVEPERVAKAVDHALFAERPKTRYVIGVPARVQAAMVRGLPDTWREAALRRLIGP